MNSFANTILTLLLGWLRTFINNLWTIAGSGGSGAFFQFFASNWKVIVLFICLCGVVIDLVIYFIRWRPYYVWSSKLNRLRKGNRNEKAAHAQHGRQEQYAAPSDVYQAEPAQEDPYAYQQEDEPYAPQQQTVLYDQPHVIPQQFQPIVQTETQQPITYAPQAALTDQTTTYAPTAYSYPEQPAYTQPELFDPIFDDAPSHWNTDDTMLQSAVNGSYQHPNHDMQGTFGMPMPEPVNSVRELQATFAQSVPAEQPASFQEPIIQQPFDTTEIKSPVHPGLDSDAFRQNFGLSPAGSLSDFNSIDYEEMDEDIWDTDEDTSSFSPFAEHEDEEMVGQRRSRNPFAGIAKRARDLVGDDEKNPLTIRDLQKTVDLRTAFHDPVYPERNNESGDY